MNITIVGTGYVGLVSGTCLAEFGHTVTCIDINTEKIVSLQQGRSPIYEPGLEDLMKKNMEAGRLFFSTNLSDALKDSNVVFIAVGTPQDEKTGQADLAAVMSCARDIALHASQDVLIVTKSTVPIDTQQKLTQHIKNIRSDLRFEVVSNPEFLREGSAVHDFLYPDRVVVGAVSEAAQEKMKQLYAYLIERGVPMVITEPCSAELIKYASNCFLATKIAFINEIADLCEKTGANINDVATAMGLDPRIGKDFLKTGPGYGGSCFPKDTRALEHSAREFGAPLTLVKAAIDANDSRKTYMAKRIQEILGHTTEKTLTILGVAFKAETDDIRESPAIPIIEALVKAGHHLKIYDPEAMDNAQRALTHLPPLTWCASISEALQKSEAAILVTEWQQFKSYDLGELATEMAVPLLIDLRNIIDKEKAADHNVTCISLGQRFIPGSLSSLPEVKKQRYA